jgi:hypothetical protein
VRDRASHRHDVAFKRRTVFMGVAGGSGLRCHVLAVPVQLPFLLRQRSIIPVEKYRMEGSVDG